MYNFNIIVNTLFNILVILFQHYYINVELDLRNVECIIFTLNACRMLNL